MRRHGQWSTSLVLATVGLVVICYLFGVPFFELVELKTFDLRLESRGPYPSGDAVVIAAIDEKSLDAEGRWPWPRSKMGKLVSILAQDGARVIGFDIGFIEPERALLAPVQGPAAERTATTHSDAFLAEAIGKSETPVVLGYFYYMDDALHGVRKERAVVEQQLSLLHTSRYPIIAWETGELEPSPFLRAYAPEGNLPLISQAAGLSGYYNTFPDKDGVIRWMPLVIKCGENVFPPLSVLCAWAYLGKPEMIVDVAAYGVRSVRLGERKIPTDENGHLLINYLGPPRTFKHISISDILAGRVPQGTFRGKIVIVGSTAEGIYDAVSTPVSPIYPGVEVHASVVENILQETFLTRPKWTRVYDLLAIIGVCLATAFVLPRSSAGGGLLFAAGLFGFHLLVAGRFFNEYGVWLNVVYPLFALLITYISLSAYHYLIEERERRKVKQTFKQYVSDKVIEIMLNNPDQLKLGGEEKELTVMFCDLVRFTNYAESFPPNQVIKILSEYFREMTDQVFVEDGMLKEYVGDELMAIFGAPVEQPDHAVRACRAALKMQKRLEQLRRSWPERGLPALEARIGINTGPMLVGNMGSDYRFSYGVLGDHVNLGSRLEGLNKLYGTQILISENTAEQVDNFFTLREVDWVRVKGKKKPVRIFEIAGWALEELTEDNQAANSFYAKGLSAYRNREWQQAKEWFERSEALKPGDKSFRVMRERCEFLQNNPPSDNWDGVFKERRK